MSGNFGRVTNYLKRNGIRKTVQLAHERTQAHYYSDYTYEKPNRKILREQCAHSVLDEGEKKLAVKPYISIIVPAYDTNVSYMRELLESVSAQTYPYWQLVIADASASDVVEEVVKHFVKEQNTCTADLLEAVYATGKSSTDIKKVKEAFEIGTKVKYVRLQENKGISGNSNQALEYVSGEYLALLDHDDILAPDALYEMVKKLNEAGQDEEIQMIYTDEDKCDESGKKFYEPNLKPDFNLDYLLSNNYICHFLMIKTELVKSLGFRPQYDGAQDYDLILRCVNRIGEKKIGHVNKVLYHWRCHAGSTSENPASKMYAYEAGRKAVEDFLKVREIPADVVHTEHVGFYRVVYKTDLFEARPEIGVLGGNVVDGRKRILSGIFCKDGTCLLEGKPSYFSGPCNRASVSQQVYAVDARTMTLREELIPLFEEYIGIPYQEDVSKRSRAYCRQMCEESWRERSIALCQEISKRSYKILWDPALQVKC